MNSENTDYKIGYDYALSLGKEIKIAEYYGKRYAYHLPSCREELEKDPYLLAYDTAEENSIFLATGEMEAYEQAKEWKHSDEWAVVYANNSFEEDYTKSDAYKYIRETSPETIYSEAYNEYISRGYSEKYSTLIATEIQNEDWQVGTIEDTEALFDDYMVLFNKAKSQNKSDNFSDFFADYTLQIEGCERIGWTVSLLREELLNKNKSEEYIKQVIDRLDQWDDIDEETLNEVSEDHWKIKEALGYADGHYYGLKNNIQDIPEFAVKMAYNYVVCMNYDYIAPIEELALYKTIIDYNKSFSPQLPITEDQFLLIEELDKEIEIDNKTQRN
ncbi:MAG: hypothetical protein Q8909_16575 [Bacteroidota bacterium]|nr:hypothetical protein [Bacteroidota bacterium]